MDRQIAGELNQIKESLKDYFKSGFNVTDQSLVALSADSRKIAKDHVFLREIMAFSESGKSPDLLPVPDLSLAMKKLEKGVSLEVGELLGLHALIVACNDLWDKFATTNSYPSLKDVALDIVNMPDMLRQLDNTFSPDGEVLDTASGTLMSIRKELKDLTAKEGAVFSHIRTKYKDYLELPDPVLRNGALTLAVKAPYRGQVPGITVDHSSSGQTLFVIPYDLLEYENKKEKLKGDEISEIDRIISALSKAFAARLSALSRNYYSYNLLDSYVAKVSFGSTYDGSLAEISVNELRITNFIHPLISLDKAVPNSIQMGNGKPKILIVSGPNAGGKSVLLKSIALAAYMNQIGLLVPARGYVSMPIFDNIFVLTGDSESLSGNLSSFSGHLKGLNQMYKEATSNSLVLVDEIGQGTSPEDGEAIGYAFIKHMENIGAFGIFTTHYDGLKKMALTDSNIMSGAMEFSKETLSPSFRFMSGAVGNSYAFEVAKKAGMASELLDTAREFKESQKRFDSEKLEQELTQKIQTVNALEKGLEEKLASANELLRRRAKEEKELEDAKEGIRKGAEVKIAKAAEDRIAELDRLWSQGNKKTLPFNQRSKIKGELRREGGLVDEGTDEYGNVMEKIKEGDIVVYQDMVGKVESIGTKKATFLYNGLSMTVPLADLRRSDAASLPPVQSQSNNIDQELLGRASKGSSRLNVIGMTVFEALPEVDKFLDDALVANIKQVTIVHGMGTFALRNGIWDHLKRLKFVKSFREGGEGEGALGATVVILK